jgi:hypothetical protein
MILRLKTPTTRRKPLTRPERLSVLAIGSYSTAPMIVERILAWEIWSR